MNVGVFSDLGIRLATAITIKGRCQLNSHQAQITRSRPANIMDEFSRKSFAAGQTEKFACRDQTQLQFCAVSKCRWLGMLSNALDVSLRRRGIEGISRYSREILSS